MVDKLYCYKLVWERVEKQGLANSGVGSFVTDDDTRFLKESTAENIF